MQVVDILRHDQYPWWQLPLKKGKRPMRRIGLNIRSVKRPSPDVIKIMNAHRVSLEGFQGGDVPDVVLRPNPALVAKRLDSGFRRDSGSGQNNDSAAIVNIGGYSSMIFTCVHLFQRQSNVLVSVEFVMKLCFHGPK